MYELLRIKSVCEAALVADDYTFFTQLRSINKSIVEYEEVRSTVTRFIHHSTVFGTTHWAPNDYFKSLSYNEESLYRLLVEKLRKKRSAVQFYEYRTRLVEDITKYIAQVTTLLTYLTDVDNVKRYFRAEHAEHIIIDDTLYFYTPRNNGYYYLEYSLSSTLSSARPPVSGTIDPDYKYISLLYRHLYPERCL